MTDVRHTINSSIESLLELGVNFRLHRHILNRHSADWRNLSAELHDDYPVKAFGIIATPTNIEKYHFLHGEELVAPEDIVHMVGDQIYDAAMASYAFTIVEMCGDDVSALLHMTNEKQRAWHTDIKQNAALDATGAEIQRSKFASPFNGDVNLVMSKSVIRLARMKSARNDFAHKGNTFVDFNQFLEDAIAVLCQIYFLCFPDEAYLKIFPYDVVWEKWEKSNLDYVVEPG